MHPYHAPSPATDGLSAGEDRLVASIVIPIRDEATHVRDLLDSLDRQTVPRDRFEVLIGDDGSTDGSIELIEADGERVRVFSGPAMNAYAARNRAAAAARAPVLAFCDADCRPEPDWLERGLLALEHADVIGGMITWIVPSGYSIWSLIEIDTYADQERAVRYGTGLTGNLFVSRELFQRIGGFDDSLPGHGDYEFVARCVDAGALLAFESSAVVHHPTHDSFGPILSRVIEMNRSYAIRESREGRLPDGLKLRSWVPLVQSMRGRRRSGRSLLLDRRRLRDSGVEPRPRDDLSALPIIYVLLPYLGGFAQLQGWVRGRRQARREIVTALAAADGRPDPPKGSNLDA